MLKKRKPRILRVPQTLQAYRYNRFSGAIYLQVSKLAESAKHKTIAEVTPDDYDIVSDWARCERLQPSGYSLVNYHGKSIPAHRLAWFLHHGQWPKRSVCHKNGNRSDNRADNLVLSGKYRAVVWENGKTVHLGYYYTEEEKNEAIFLYKIGLFNKKV